MIQITPRNTWETALHFHRGWKKMMEHTKGARKTIKRPKWLRFYGVLWWLEEFLYSIVIPMGLWYGAGCLRCTSDGDAPRSQL
jgi:hypothetical protein